jgi:2-polyprenyl-3-methyl-5-hydroxy-6-metoxy-1,4-benzoquinol methylase
MDKKLRNKLKAILDLTPFSPKHIGDYVRQGCFWKCVGTLSLGRYAAILDAGCGDGHYAVKMGRKFPYARVTAMDIRPVISLNKFPTNVSVVSGDLLFLRTADTYDIIYSIDVLEHIPGNCRIIQNFFRALKPGGYLYIHMPNKTDGRYIFPSKFFETFRAWENDEHIGERYTLDELKDMVKGYGFEVIKTQHTFGIVGRFAWELDRITDGKPAIKIFLMPLMRVLGSVAIRLKPKNGDLLVLARKCLTS